MIRAVIIDDEKNNIDNIVTLLQKHELPVDVVGLATNADEGIATILSTKPDLLFLDIQMPVKNGFDVLKALPHYQFEVIFVTAFDQYGIQAVKFSAIDYLLKPISPDELKISIRKVEAKLSQKKANFQLENLMELIRDKDAKKDHKLALASTKEIRFVHTGEIIRCESSNAYTQFYLTDGKSILVSKPIFEYEELLLNYDFIRCHQSHLINIKFVKSLVKEDSGYLLLNDDTRIPISRGKKKTYLKLYIPSKNKPLNAMKYLLFLTLALACSKLNAQNRSPMTIEDKKMDNYLTARKPAILTIHLKNLPADGKKVNIKYTLVQLGIGFQTAKYAETDPAGVAILVLDQNYPWQQIWLSAGDYLYAGIYINEGLTVTIDAQKTAAHSAYMIGDGVEYSGPDGELNTVMNENVLFKKQQKEALDSKLSTLFQTRRELNTDSFFVSVDSIRQQLTQIDKEFIADHPKYSWAINNQTLSDFYGNLCVSYWGDVMPDSLFKEISKHQPYFTNNEGVLFYKYLQIYTKSQKNDQRGNGLEGTMSWYDLIFTPQKSDMLKLFLLDDEKDSFAQSFPLIVNSIQTKWDKKIASDALEELNITQKKIDSLFAKSKKIENADIGKPLVKLPFEAELYQIDTLKSVDDFLLSLKSKFAKKALIIDFWATWCAPCLSDLPFSKSLHEANKDLPIEYVYLCTNSSSNINIWKNKVAELQMPGTHIFVDDKIITQLKTMLNATSGFPAYVVIDANGKVNTKAISRMEILNRDGIKQAAGL